MTTISFAPTRSAALNSFISIDRARGLQEQVLESIEKVGPALKGATEINLVGMPAPAVLQVAAFELAIGLPTISVVEPGRPGGPEPRYVGPMSLDHYRHKVAREYRTTAWREGDGFPGWTVLNGSGREIPAYQLEELAALRGIQVADIRVLEAPADRIADFSDPAAGMAAKLADLPLTRADWHSGRLIVFLPGLGLAGTLFATSVYALAERWPIVASLQAGEDRSFHVVELLDPQPLRDWGQALAVRWEADTANEALAALAKALNKRRKMSAKTEGQTLLVTIGDQKFQVVVTTAKKVS